MDPLSPNMKSPHLNMPPSWHPPCPCPHCPRAAGPAGAWEGEGVGAGKGVGPPRHALPIPTLTVPQLPLAKPPKHGPAGNKA